MRCDSAFVGKAFGGSFWGRLAACKCSTTNPRREAAPSTSFCDRYFYEHWCRQSPRQPTRPVHRPRHFYSLPFTSSILLLLLLKTSLPSTARWIYLANGVRAPRRQIRWTLTDSRHLCERDSKQRLFGFIDTKTHCTWRYSLSCCTFSSTKHTKIACRVGAAGGKTQPHEGDVRKALATRRCPHAGPQHRCTKSTPHIQHRQAAPVSCNNLPPRMSEWQFTHVRVPVATRQTSNVLALLLLPLLCAVGLLGNLLVCMAIWFDRRLHNVTNYFLFSLALADLFVCSIVMPLSLLVEVRHGKWERFFDICSRKFNTNITQHVCNTIND